MFESLKNRIEINKFVNRSIPMLYVSVTHPLLWCINNNHFDPFPNQSLDFRMAGGSAGFMMYVVGDKNKKLEFLAAMSPAIIGSLDEITNFFHRVYGMDSNIFDGKDVLAYFSGALLTYGITKLIRKGIQSFQGQTEMNKSENLSPQVM
jgi:hypothetical protein